MTENYYLDTSIWLDIYEKRGENGEEAIELVKWIIKRKSLIFFSDFTIKEFKGLGFFATEIVDILSAIKPDYLRKAHVFKEQLELARKLASKRNIPLIDTIHAVIARDNQLCLISRDQHFNRLRDITKVKSPKEILGE